MRSLAWSMPQPGMPRSPGPPWSEKYTKTLSSGAGLITFWLPLVPFTPALSPLSTARKVRAFTSRPV